MRPDSPADFLERSFDESPHRPGAGVAADPIEEIAQDRRAIGRVRHLGVKLETINRQPVMAGRGDRARRGGGQRDEIGTQVLDLVAVTHPDDNLTRDILKQRLSRIDHAAGGAAELACRGRNDLGTQIQARQLHPVANPQDRHAQREDPRIAAGSAGFVDAGRSPRKNQGERVELAHALGRNVMTDNPRIGVPFADAPGDQLNVLGPEIENEHGTRRRVEIRHGVPSDHDSIRVENCRDSD